MGLNKFSDLTADEWKMMFGHIPLNSSDYKSTSKDEEEDEFKEPPKWVGTEDYVDWREWGAVTPVKD